jgi:hypothetical protein
MKIGFSYSRCVRDIIDGKIDIDDVLVIIARTDFDPHNDEQWASIWSGYRMRQGWSAPEWVDYPEEDEDRFRSVSIELWELGKLHQPRKFGAHPPRAYDIWVDTGPMPGDLFGKPDAVNEAWANYQMLAALTTKC